MSNGTLQLGLDVGSTTVKLVLLDGNTKEILYKRYERHNTEQVVTVKRLLSEAAYKFPHYKVKIAICGSGGRPIAEMLNGHYVQEVVANSIAVRQLYPQTRTAIEIGGQDSKAVFFYYDEKAERLVVSDMRMNGSCAGGTGAFIDEIANLLQVPIDDFNALAAKGKASHTISGRCGVFAKTDIQSILNQGGKREDIAVSSLHAIVKQIIGGLAQGLELKPPILFAGGPCVFNDQLIQAFRERLDLKEGDIILPANGEILIAKGAALALDELFGGEKGVATLAELVADLEQNREAVHALETSEELFFFSSEKEQADWKLRHALPKDSYPLEEKIKRTEGDRHAVLPVYIGVDAGSTTSKFVLLDEEENVVDSFYSRNQGDPLRIIQKGLLDMQAKYLKLGVTLEVLGLGSTGYGELLFAKAFGADYHGVETVSHAEAAAKYVPDVSFILDIGGQDMKAIWLKDGVITNIILNEACSSGCGSFIENYADSLGVAVDAIANLAFGAKQPAQLGSRCTVFMNSTIITEQKNGRQSDDIMAGLSRAIIENVFTKVIRVSNLASLGEKIVVQGGTFKNDAVLRALEQYMEKEVFRAPYPGLMGCIGVALLTKNSKMQKDAKEKSNFIGFTALEAFDYKQSSNIPCNLCANHCLRTEIVFAGGSSWVTGNRCELGGVIATKGQEKQKAAKAPAFNMFLYREAQLLKEYPFTKVSEDKNMVIGLPRVLDFWESMPFWTTFLKALGFQVAVSPPSNVEQYEKGIPYVVSDTVCFPAKIVHGHIQDLVAMGVDRIFMPMPMETPDETVNQGSIHFCPVLKGYPYIIQHSENPQKRWDMPFDAPMFHWFGEKDKKRQLIRYMLEAFGLEKDKVLEAVKQGDGAMKLFRFHLREQGKRIMKQVRAEGEYAVVLAGRPYHNDPYVSKDLSRVFTKEGISVLTVDALEEMEKVSLRNTRMEITNHFHLRMLSGAMLAAQHPELEYAQIVSFGCGHDAILSDEIVRIMGEVGEKAPLILKLDEGDATNSIYIRVKSFLNTVETKRAKEERQNQEVGQLTDAYPAKFMTEDKKIRTLLVPNVSVAFCKLMSSVLSKQGLTIESIDLGGAKEIALGKKYVHNDTCFPAQMVIGEAISALESGKYKADEVAVVMAKYHGDCRLSHYSALLRLALDEAGFKDVPILSTDPVDTKTMHPGLKLGPYFEILGLWVLIMMDILEELRRQIRPYEINKGETDQVFDEVIDDISKGILKGIGPAISAYKKGIKKFCDITYNRDNPRPRIFITGEWLVTFHPGSNYNIEEYLEKNGMEVILPRLTNVIRKDVLARLSHIKDFKVSFPLSEVLFAHIKEGLFAHITNKLEGIANQHPLHHPHPEFSRLACKADPILHKTYTSGEGWLIPAEIVEYAQNGVNAFVILQPFGCLPNHICGRGIIKRIKEDFPLAQILPIDLDPDSSFANIENRLQMLIINEKARA